MPGYQGDFHGDREVEVTREEKMPEGCLLLSLVMLSLVDPLTQVE